MSCHLVGESAKNVQPQDLAHQETQIRLDLYSSMLISACSGIYLVVYLQTSYIVVRRKDRNHRNSIMIILGVLFTLSILGTAIRCYAIDREFVAFAAAQQPINLTVPQNLLPGGLHLIENAAFYGSCIIADCLMLWRCYHVWGGSRLIIAVPSIILICEIVDYFFTIIFISANITNVTPSKAMIFDTLQLTLYITPAILSIITTTLISYRIIAVNKSRNRHLRRLVDIIAQSSAVYTLILVLRAALSTSVPDAQRTSSRLQIISSTDTYLEILLLSIVGLAPTAMIARATLLADEEDSRVLSSMRSPIQFVPRSAMQPSRNYDVEQALKPESMNPGVLGDGALTRHTT
ncbi:hypothetical protein CPC08DRAFT_160022 [Agrocybe pediades]|nr:hypothetical protein CPC08DRAFT_160022 [Agrocybe pediades]